MSSGTDDGDVNDAPSSVQPFPSRAFVILDFFSDSCASLPRHYGSARSGRRLKQPSPGKECFLTSVDRNAGYPLMRWMQRTS